MIGIEALTKGLSRADRGRPRQPPVADDGEIAVIVGTSGSGKTTLLRMINRLIEPTFWHGEDRRAGYPGRAGLRAEAPDAATPSRGTGCSRIARWARTSPLCRRCWAGTNP